MKKPLLPNPRAAEHDLGQYLVDRPELLLKMLDIAEASHGGKRAAGNAKSLRRAPLPFGETPVRTSIPNTNAGRC